MADEPADQCGLRLRLLELVRILGDDVVDDRLDRGEIGHLLHAARFDDGIGIAALAPDDLEQVFGDLAGNRAGGDQVEDRAELRGRHWRIQNVAPFLVEPAGELVDHPVGGRLGIARRAVGLLRHRLEEVSSLALGGENAGIVGGKPVFAREAALLLVRKFGEVRAEIVDEGLRELERQQVRVGKVAVVVRLLLVAHGASLAFVRIEQARLLIDPAALLQDLDLPPRLVIDRLADEPDGVDVLDLAARTERGARLAHGHVHVRAQVALLHVAVAGAEIAQDRPQLRHIGFRVL